MRTRCRTSLRRKNPLPPPISTKSSRAKTVEGLIKHALSTDLLGVQRVVWGLVAAVAVPVARAEALGIMPSDRATYALYRVRAWCEGEAVSTKELEHIHKGLSAEYEKNQKKTMRFQQPGEHEHELRLLYGLEATLWSAMACVKMAMEWPPYGSSILDRPRGRYMFDKEVAHVLRQTARALSNFGEDYEAAREQLTGTFLAAMEAP